MGPDDDIAASLPRPPPPRAARREAAIARALERFDGGGGRRVLEEVRAGSPWRIRFGRPYAGALAGAFLVALVALPLAWKSVPEPVREGGRDRRSEPVAQVVDAGQATADARPPAPAASPAAPAPRHAPAPEPASPGAPAEPAAELPVPPPSPAAEPVQPAADAGAGLMADSDANSEITVTGTLVRHPNLESSAPVTVVGEDSAI